MRNIDILRLKDDLIKVTNNFMMETNAPVALTVFIYESILGEIKTLMDTEVREEVIKEQSDAELKEFIGDAIPKEEYDAMVEREQQLAEGKES